MSCISRSIAGILLGLSITQICFQQAAAQEWPTKPIKLVVPNAPGAAHDNVARILGPAMSKILGQPVVIENKPGAGGIIGSEYVAKQAADGYTIVIAVVESLAILPVTTKDLRFDPIKDLPPLIGIGGARLVLGTSARNPWKSFQELVSYARLNPGKLNYGESGTLVRLLSEVVIRESTIDVVRIPFSVGATYIQALTAGDVQFGFLQQADAIALGDRLRILAVSGAKRSPLLQDVPTFVELGLSEMPGVTFSLNTPFGVPQPILSKLYEAASSALQQTEVATSLNKFQFEIVAQPPEVAAQKLAQQAKLFSEVAKRVGVQPQ